MASSKWREACKFLSGATCVGAIANGYLWASKASVPFLGGTVPPGLFGLRAIGATLLFVLFLYAGYLKPARPGSDSS